MKKIEAMILIAALLALSAGAAFAETVEDGDVLHRGGFSFECICTPGHTPGHMCLYDREKRVFLSGDHVLFDISPNITCWSTMHDALGSYIESLRGWRSWRSRRRCRATETAAV